jgi:hypothetical protein
LIRPPSSLTRINIGVKLRPFSVPSSASIRRQALKKGGPLERLSYANQSTLQLFRSRLNDSKDVDYANYFQKHPDLDEPELYVRCVKGKKAEKVFRDLCSDINKELSNLEL